MAPSVGPALFARLQPMVSRGRQCCAAYQADAYRAINLPLSAPCRAAATLDPASGDVVYCQTGRCRSAVAFLLSRRGLRASSLDGGMKARTRTRESVA